MDRRAAMMRYFERRRDFLRRAELARDNAVSKEGGFEATKEVSSLNRIVAHLAEMETER